MTDPLENATLLAKASTAEVFAWGAGQVLKLFHEHVPFHANEVSATRVAHQARLPVPAVIDGLIEVGGREGIIFERVDGQVMTEYLEGHPDEVEECAHKAAELHARIHATQAPDLFPLQEIHSMSLQQANSLEETTHQAVLDIFNRLPAGESLCHNDFYPNNIIVSLQGAVVIDWAIGARGNPLADLARTWLISKMWLDGLEDQKTPRDLQFVWHRFWELYFRRYAELHPFNPEEFAQWQIVVTTVSLVWDRSIASAARRISFIDAALGEARHPWLKD